MIVYKIATLAAFVVAAAWAINKPAYDSISTAIGFLAAFISAFFFEHRKKQSAVTQNVERQSVGIQVTGKSKNIKITNKN